MEVEGALRALFQEGARESYSCLLPHLMMLAERFENATVTEDQLSRITAGLSKIYSAASSNPPSSEDRRDFDTATLKLLDSMAKAIKTQEHLRDIVGCLLMIINCHTTTYPYHASSTSPSLYTLAVRAMLSAQEHASGVTPDMVKLLLQCYEQPHDRVACSEALGAMAKLMGLGGGDDDDDAQLLVLKKLVLDVISSGDPDTIPEMVLEEMAAYLIHHGPYPAHILSQDDLDGILGPALISLLHKRPSESLFSALDKFFIQTSITPALLVQGGAIQAVILALKTLLKDSSCDRGSVGDNAYFVLESLIDIDTKTAAMMLHGCGGIEVLLDAATKADDGITFGEWLAGVLKAMVKEAGEAMAVQCIKKGTTPILRSLWGFQRREEWQEDPAIEDASLQKVLESSSGMRSLLGELRLPLADRQAATWVACFLASHAPTSLLVDVMIERGCLDLLCNALSPATCSCHATAGSEQCKQSTADHATASKRVDGDADAAPSCKRQRTESSLNATCTCPGHPRLRAETWRAAAQSLQRLWAVVTATGDASAGVAVKMSVLEEYINNERFSDMKFIVEGRPFYAYRMFVREASELLRGITDENWDRREVVVDDVSYAVWELAMRFAHTGTADIPAELLHSVLLAADQYLLDGLKVHCQEQLVARLQPADLPEMMQLCNERCLPVLQQHCVKVALEQWADFCTITPSTSPQLDDLLDLPLRARVVDVIRLHVRQHLGRV